MQLTRPFVRLPFRFDAPRLRREVEALPPTAWMPHPTGQPGNSAVPLISRDGGDNDAFTGAMLPTPHLERSTYHRQAMAAFGEVLARSRLMKLSAGSEVGLHVDFNYHWYTRVRVHVPIVTNPAVTFRCGDEHVHMGAGECWLFDNWRRHNVINASREDRVHLVMDLAGSSRFWRLVESVQALDPVANQAQLAGMEQCISYREDYVPALLTERFNASPVMAPGELRALVDELIDDFSRHGANDSDLVRRYRRLLTDFALDWREAWHRYGITRAGIPHYQRLIERAAKSLHPDRRALVAASNDVGVNPIIMQRILRPALAPELLGDFVDSVADTAGGASTGTAAAQEE